jgi:hypothetical protein
VWIDSRASGTLRSHSRALSRGTLAAGGGWTFIPTQGGVTTKGRVVWI